MSRLGRGLLKGYTWLLKLYPPRYQDEFAGERREVFSLALQEAVRRGKAALFSLALRELRDFPLSALRANAREWEGIMKTVASKLGEEGFSWLGLLLGAWPFVFLGPCMAVAPYLPRAAARLLTYDTPFFLASLLVPTLIGLLVGWRRGFPRWVYPYLVILFFVVAIPLIGRFSTLLGQFRFNPWVGTSILLAAILLLGAGAVFLLSRIPPARKILQDVRADWTRLSFGMAIYIAFASGFYGGDHLPPLGPAVWLPPVLVVAGAAGYLLCRSRLARSLVLLVMLLILLGKGLLPGDDRWSIFAVLLLALLYLLPALVELLPRRGVSVG